MLESTRAILIGAIVLLSAAPRGDAGGPPLYEMTRLEGLPSFLAESVAGSGINDAGQVIGTSFVFSGTIETRPVTWLPGQTTPTDLSPGQSSNVPRVESISPSGIIAGRFTNGATIWHNGASITLDPLPGDGTAWAFDVNDSGDAVGASIDSNGFSRPVLWHNVMSPGGPSAPVLLPTIDGLVGAKFAFGISENGVIAGREDSGVDPYRNAVAWNDAGSGYALTVLDLFVGAPDPGLTSAAGISDDGQTIPGAGLGPDSKIHALSWAPSGAFTYLGLFADRYASAIAANNAGVAVGTGDIAFEDPRALLFFEGAIYNLNDLVVNPPANLILRSATGINNFGVIVANGEAPLPSGTNHAWTLTPIPNVPFLLGDVDVNGVVAFDDVDDMIELQLGMPGAPGAFERADVNTDGEVNGGDLQGFILLVMQP